MALQSMRISHIWMNRIRAANIRGLFFARTATNLGYRIFRRLPCWELSYSQLKRASDSHSLRKKNLIFIIGMLQRWAQIIVRNVNMDQDGSGSFFIRSGSLKELWQFRELFKSESELKQNPPYLSTLFYINGCHTQGAIALKRPFLNGKMGWRILI
jgi:hypothetical protein